MNSDHELTQLRQRVTELERSEARYRNIFESSPISLWEEDWSAVKQYLDRILATGADLDAHLRQHVDDVIACVGLVRILDVNRATLELCQAQDKDQLLRALSVVFNENTLDTFRRELVALGCGAMSYEEETVVRTLLGEDRNVMFRVVVSADCEQTWERCLVSLVDITDRKRTEEALRLSKEETIQAQRELLARLSAPVIPISDDVIVMPFIGQLDQARMQQALGVLLDEVRRLRVTTAILDITGVPEIDAEGTQGLIQAAQAVRLLGAQVVLTGIRPGIAQNLVALGSNLDELVTRGTLQTGIAFAMQNSRARR
ncbi:STAS domain-containing protein [Nannocystis punicea]|uniref:STAS domain-containing protein n=1 Tax=Nannocystis punicea TaxID=2995304 RepID=A0ABY7GUF1_9BACT|nr:STAS domain-containing protein [Nannocystis poenicansa]WAS90565.1 STAS domain-containing protein [Nannocystis poenicansa]